MYTSVIDTCHLHFRGNFLFQCHEIEVISLCLFWKSLDSWRRKEETHSRLVHKTWTPWLQTCQTTDLSILIHCWSTVGSTEPHDFQLELESLDESPHNNSDLRITTTVSVSVLTSSVLTHYHDDPSFTSDDLTSHTPQNLPVAAAASTFLASSLLLKFATRDFTAPQSVRKVDCRKHGLRRCHFLFRRLGIEGIHYVHSKRDSIRDPELKKHTPEGHLCRTS
jgi:hypothetical protein